MRGLTRQRLAADGESASENRGDFHKLRRDITRVSRAVRLVLLKYCSARARGFMVRFPLAVRATRILKLQKPMALLSLRRCFGVLR
jgi:hypothetical protein